MNFSERQILCAGTCKNRIDKPKQMPWSHCHNSILEFLLPQFCIGIPLMIVFDDNNQDKIKDSFAKKNPLSKRVRLSLRGKKSSNKSVYQNCNEKMKYLLFLSLSKKKLKNLYVTTFGNTNSTVSQKRSSTFDMQRWASYFRHRYSAKFFKD